MDSTGKHTGKRAWTRVDERSRQEEGQSTQPCIRALVDSPDRGRPPEHRPGSEELRPPYRHKNIDTYFEKNEEFQTLRKKQKTHGSHRVDGGTGGGGGEGSASSPANSNYRSSESDSESDSDSDSESDVSTSMRDGDGWSDCSYSDNDGDWDDLEEWQEVAVAYQNWFKNDARLGVMKRDLPAGSVVSMPRRLNNSLFSDVPPDGASHESQLDAYDSDDDDTIPSSHAPQGELSMAYLLGVSGVTATKTPQEHMTSLQETQFVEPPGRWAPGELWACDDDLDGVLQRLGKLSFDTGENLHLQRLHGSSGNSSRRGAHIGADEEAPSHASTSSDKCSSSSSMHRTYTTTTKKATPTRKGKGKKVYHANDEEEEEEEEEEGEDKSMNSPRTFRGGEGRGASHRRRPRQENRCMPEETDHYHEASTKGYADGMKRHREEAAELDAELVYSTYGNLVDLANKIPGVSADTLQSIKETQEKYPETGTVRVAVVDEGEWRRARATHARLRADQFTPGDACDYCMFMGTTMGYADPSNNTTHIAAKTAARVMMERFATDGRLVIGGYRTYHADEIEKVYMRYLRTLPLSPSDLEKMRPPRSMTLHHFFDKNGCTSGPLHIVNDFIRHLDSTNDTMRQQLYEQRVCMGGVPIGTPEVNPKIHKMLMENANTLVKLTKERREIQRETPSYVDTAQSQLVTAQQRAAMALVGQSGAASLAGSNRM